ncbi:MAG: glycoside hydrolase family 25 protein [Eubacterium sp.]|nr:glycoside hydrolase family 25 protein [Eubacterium sp.]
MHDYDWSYLINDGQDVSYDDGIYTVKKGIDVSYHQGEIDWNEVASDGIEFAILRIGYRGYGSEGTLNEDVKFREYIDEAHAAGISVGVYFFSQAISEEEAEEEAQFVLDILADYEIELPVIYDPETISDDDARTDDLTGEQATKNTIAFCDYIEEAGYKPMVYSNMVWEADYFDMSELTDYEFWYADYEKYPQTPYAFSMWQYTEKGSVAGISGRVDLDVMFVEK